ncbi:Cpr [Symbiodinium sp. CCMP2456]|nr:Cpr [Symbiodinium sp. CCMP2456]
MHTHIHTCPQTRHPRSGTDVEPTSTAPAVPETPPVIAPATALAAPDVPETHPVIAPAPATALAAPDKASKSPTPAQAPDAAAPAPSTPASTTGAPAPSTPASTIGAPTPSPASTTGASDQTQFLANLLVQMQAAGAGPEQLQPVVDAIAKAFVQQPPAVPESPQSVLTDEIAIELGAPADYCAQVAELLEKGQDPNKLGAPGGTLALPPSVPPGADLPPPPPVDTTKKGGKKNDEGDQPKKKGSELEIDLAKLMTAKEFDLDDFVTTWVSACTAAEGKAVVTKIEFLRLSLIMSAGSFDSPTHKQHYIHIL